MADQEPRESQEGRQPTTIRRLSDGASQMANEVSNTATEVWLVVRLTGSLLWALRTSALWIVMACRLLGYVVLLLPAFLRMVGHWGLHPSVLKGVRYGLKRRNRVDVYRLRQEELLGGRKAPVVVFVSGGAWIIGYKAWGALMGMVFQRQGVLFFAPDYRNFPQGNADDMLEDVTQAIQWVFDNCEGFGGDKDRIYLIGQSAGAHLSSTALLRRCEEIYAMEDGADGTWGPEAKVSWRPDRLRAYVGISGPFDLVSLQSHFNKRGLHSSIFGTIFGGDPSRFSPCHILRDWDSGRTRFGAISDTGKRAASSKGKPYQRHQVDADRVRHPAALLPPTLLVHGTADCSVPYSNALDLGIQLRNVGKAACNPHRVGVRLYEDKSHTDPILEDPMGGDDSLMEDLMYLILEEDSDAAIGEIIARGNEAAFDEKKRRMLRTAVGTRMLPRFVIQIARRVNPF